MFVSLGNHDSYPNGEEDFKVLEPAAGVRQLLKFWVPQEQWDLHDKHTYYTQDIPSLNARIISLNTESCDFHNLYLWG